MGLVCITASTQVRYRTITRTRLLQLAVPEQKQRLRQLYWENLHRLNQAIAFCQARGIHLYRLISGLFPFADTPLGEEILPELTAALGETGQAAIRAGLRLVIHPDQFVVLNSDKPEVIQNSIAILQTHAGILDLLQQPRSPWAAIELHGGKRDRPERLVQIIRELPEGIRTRLVLENDEFAYGATEILEVCAAAGIPMVFDAHHHVINKQLQSYDHPSVGEALAAARSTWLIPEWQLVHISNGCHSFRDPRHSDLITTLPACFVHAPWIEVEAKLKEQAIAKLEAEWLPTWGGS